MYLGHYEDMPSDEYHGDTTSFSRSSIMEFMKSPYHFWSKYLNPNAPPQEKDSKSVNIGKAFHTMILEPHKFNEQFAPKPPRVLLKDVGREAYDEYKKAVEDIENSNRIILKDEEYLDLLGMKESLLKHSQAQELIAECAIEQSFFWIDKESGLKVKSRPDLLDLNAYIDLKTVSDASERAFQHEMIKYGYHIQAAMLRDAIREIKGQEINLFFNICVETKYPYPVVIYMLDQEVVDFGEAVYKQKLIDIGSCIAHNKWDSYESKLIGLPRWVSS